MPALVPTDIYGKITFLGHVPQQNAPDAGGASLDRVTFGFGGVEGDVHAGVTRPACSRVRAQHPTGTEIANVRQLSVMSAEELEKIAEAMGVSEINPIWAKASLVLNGIPDFSHVPPSSRLQGPDGLTLVVDMQNRPCHLPAQIMQPILGERARRFKSAAQGCRGVTAWVERVGSAKIGDLLRLHVPDQRAWIAEK